MREEWEPKVGQVVIDRRRETEGAKGEVVRCDGYGHFADPYWRAAVRWSNGYIEEHVPTTWLIREEPVMWGTRTCYAEGAPEVALANGEKRARYFYELWRDMPYPYVVSGGRTATRLELVSRTDDGEWQVVE